MLRPWILTAWTIWLAMLCCFARAGIPPEIVTKGKQATVLVETEDGRRSGSAFCVDRAGFFVTNAHVAGARGAKLSLVLNPGEVDQKVLQARVVRADKAADLALLKAENSPPLTPLELGEIRGLVETQAVTAFGYPFGKELAVRAGVYPSVTVSTGRITSLRKVGGELQQIQLDASVNPGNSGGPVLNDKGQVVGVVVSYIPGSGISFAIPASLVRQMLTQVEIVFTPPPVSLVDQHEAHEFAIQVAHFFQPIGGITVELTLSANSGPPRNFPAKSIDGQRFAVSAVPVPPLAGPHLLRLTVKYPDGEILCTVKDQSVSFGATTVKLSQIQRIERGDHGNVTLADGKLVSAQITGGESIVTELGGKAISLDLKQATAIAIEDAEPPVQAIHYQIVARQGGAVVGRETGEIDIAGAAVSLAQSRPSLELFVCSFETKEIKRYNGRTGVFLNDFAIGNGLQEPHNAVFGRDGQLYVSCGNGPVLRFSGKTGQFIDKFASGSGLDNATGLAFGPDGNLYVADAWSSTIKRFDARTGAFLADFVKKEAGGLSVCGNMIFGPDGNLYAASFHSNQVKRYDGRTGAFLGDFAGGNGLDTPAGMAFGKDGCLYVASRQSSEVKRFDGKTGAFLDNFITAGSAGLIRPEGIEFGPDGNLYVADSEGSCIKRFNGRTGAFLDDFIPKASGRLNAPVSFIFRSNGGRP